MTKFLFTILLIGLAGLVFFRFAQPVLDEIGTRRDEKALLEAGLENAKKLREVQEQLLAVYNSFSTADLDSLNKFLPDHIDIVRLVIDINTIAERSGMGIKNIRLSLTEEEKAAVAGEEATAAARPASGVAIFGFSVTGPYTNFQSFVSDLAQSLRLVDVKTLELIPREDGLNEYNLEVQTYWLK